MHYLTYTLAGTLVQELRSLPIQVPWHALFSVGLAVGLAPPNVESMFTCDSSIVKQKHKVTSTVLQNMKDCYKSSKKHVYALCPNNRM